MSDTRRVEFDTKQGELVMRALADTHGMPVPQKANHWLERLMKAEHKGPHDTWTAARDRVAINIGLEPCTAQRIWQRWQGMKTVGGDAVIKLMLAYEALCQKTENAADAMGEQRLTLRVNNEIAQGSASAGQGMDSA